MEPRDEVEGIDDGAHRVVLFLQLFPFVLPYDDDAVTRGQQSIFFAFGSFVGVSHCLIAHFVTRFVAVGVTLGAAVPKATVKFVHDI